MKIVKRENWDEVLIIKKEAKERKLQRRKERKEIKEKPFNGIFTHSGGNNGRIFK